MNRADLLKLLMDQMEENRLLEAGTLAEAALSLSGIFEAAANAYLSNIRRMA